MRSRSQKNSFSPYDLAAEPTTRFSSVFSLLSSEHYHPNLNLASREQDDVVSFLLHLQPLVQCKNRREVHGRPLHLFISYAILC